MPKMEHSGAILTIDLGAVCANWLSLRERLSGLAECAGVVKADGYGLGAEKVAAALSGAGCRIFFVAHLDEALGLRAVLPDAEIHVLNGLMPGCAPEYIENRLVPVLNDLGSIDAWREFCVAQDQALPADVHVDTGMSRLGLPPGEVAILADQPHRLEGFTLANLISHLACADEPDHPLNRQQLADYRTALATLPAARRSFANSSGIFLGAEYHFDLARPGVALYGGNPTPGKPNPMTQVIRLQGKILQVRDVDTPLTVGYGATHKVTGPTRVATVAVGYADGFLRSLSSSGYGYIGGVRVPIIGRVSMDLITLDVSSVPHSQSLPGGLIDLIGPDNPVDAVAESAGTIGYEILTSLGRRYHRVYVDGN
ncbi:MAG: alanine racemase [Rhodospirillales bacterium]|nr:alanine racemase [Rhodospirillales bacterium]